MLFAVSLIPIIVYIIFIYKIDHFALISIKRLLLLVLIGMLTALACFGLFLLTDRVISGVCADVIHPVIEELVKSIPLLILAFRKRIAFFIDSVICGAAVGGGFSIPWLRGSPYSHGLQRYHSSRNDDGRTTDRTQTLANAHEH